MITQLTSFKHPASTSHTHHVYFKPQEGYYAALRNLCLFHDPTCLFGVAVALDDGNCLCIVKTNLTAAEIEHLCRFANAVRKVL